MTWRRLGREDRDAALLWGAVAVAAVALRPLWLVAPRLLEPCLLREWTGIPCPTCGTTRAAVAVLSGRPVEGLVLNPLATLAGVGLVGAGLLAPLWWLLRLPVPALPHLIPRSWLLAALGVLVANWIYLVIRGI